jgi:hypothetical protein
MRPLDLLAWFVGGMMLMNALPHLAAGMMGRRFPSPFAKPPGKGLSSPTVNVFWGFANLAVAYLLLCRVGRFDLRDGAHAAALGLGMLLIGLVCARQFDGLNSGRGPDPA